MNILHINVHIFKCFFDYVLIMSSPVGHKLMKTWMGSVNCYILRAVNAT